MTDDLLRTMGERRAPSDGTERSLASPLIVEISDEREPLAQATLELIAASFPAHERQPPAELRSELEEKRRDLLRPFDFHLLAAVSESGAPLAAAAGVYLAGVNAGFVSYLAVHPNARRSGLGGATRGALVEAFRQDALRAGRGELAGVLGEVRADSGWLANLTRTQGAIAFDLNYYHPGMRLGQAPPFVLYREPVGDTRFEIPVDEVRQIIYAVWRRAYRVRYPLERETFRAMLDELNGRDAVGARPLTR